MFGNAIPSAAVLCMAMGLLSMDGLFVLIGMVLGVIGIAVSTMVVLLGIGAVKLITHKLFSIFVS
jgi:hypothetical protein